jgi:hypothetical protein
MGMKTSIKATVLFVLTALASACSPKDPLIVDKNWVPKRMVGYITQLEPGYYGAKLTRVVYNNNKEMKADLVEVQFIGQLAARNKPPFNIFAARRCHECESNPSIYIHSPGDGRLRKDSQRYRYPGRVYSHVNGALVEESRAFFGDCLAGRSPGIVVWFIRTRLDRPTWVEKVEVVESTGTSLAFSEIEAPIPPIDATLKLVEEHRCREIPKRLMSTEP